MSLLHHFSVRTHEDPAATCCFLGSSCDSCPEDAAYDLVANVGWLVMSRIPVCMEHARHAVLMGALPPLE